VQHMVSSVGEDLAEARELRAMSLVALTALS
jgi:hypothetical protein